MSIRQSRSRLEKSALRILGEIILRIKIQMESDTALKNPYELKKCVRKSGKIQLEELHDVIQVIKRNIKQQYTLIQFIKIIILLIRRI